MQLPLSSNISHKTINQILHCVQDDKQPGLQIATIIIVQPLQCFILPPIITPLPCHPEPSEGSEAYIKGKTAMKKIIFHKRIRTKNGFP